ncbi:MAG: hypothetical protein LBN97_09525 [Oscillospiraceae bacterium]|jgi:hypothetical protein|nr:hypothetical protein [Oscillospiraceae bacterium]
MEDVKIYEKEAKAADTRAEAPLDFALEVPQIPEVPEQPEFDAELLRELRMRDIDEFLRDYPNVTPRTIPEEVWDEVNRGKSLVTAYLHWENSQLRTKTYADIERAVGSERTTGSRKGVGQPPVRDEFASMLLS